MSALSRRLEEMRELRALRARVSMRRCLYCGAFSCPHSAIRSDDPTWQRAGSRVLDGVFERESTAIASR